MQRLITRGRPGGAVLLFVVASSLAAAAPEEVRAALARDFREVEGRMMRAGVADWLFLDSELAAYARGPFWGDAAKAVYPAAKDPDPTVAIVDFAQQCGKAGATLLVVPVPGKVALHPERLRADLATTGRVDDVHRAFLDHLAAQGVGVLDLGPAFAALKQAGVPTHLRQDSHWSPQAMARTAALIAERIRTGPWVAGVPRQAVAKQAKAIETMGDLVVDGHDLPELDPEPLTVETVTLGGAPVANDPRSPVLLIGDSHTLVFGSQLICTDAGLAEHLAAQLGFAVDNLGNQGDGVNQGRGMLARRKDDLAGKKAVVWIFAARLFTEHGEAGWRRIPVVAGGAAR